MSPEPGAERVEERASEMLPEERHAGTSAPEEQAAAILADSDERQDSRDRSAGSVDHRRAAGPERAADRP